MRTLRLAFVVVSLTAFLAPPTQARHCPDELTRLIPPRDPTANSVGTHLQSAPYTRADYIAALTWGADRLLALQADITEDNAGNGAPDADPGDGGWDWDVDPAATQHSAQASSKNSYGVTALGILELCAYSGEPRYWTALFDVYAGIAADPEIDSCGDFRFLVRLSELTHDPTYASLARARYDARIGAHGSATAFAEEIRDTHFAHGRANGLIPWDIGLCATDAAALDVYFPGSGYDADADAMANVIYADSFEDNPGYFDESDSTENYWAMGIAGILSSFEAAHLYQAEAATLAQALIDYQNDGIAKSPPGAWDWNDTHGGGDYQTTAYVVMALTAYGSDEGRIAAVDGVDWLISEQRPNGSWHREGHDEYTEEEGEILTAIALAVGQENPTAVTLASFTAQTHGAGSVVLAWETTAEVDNAGFNLYRATVVDGPYARFNATFIAAEGDPVSGASYIFLDNGLPPGTYYYKLEDVDTGGQTTLHGPVSAVVPPPLRRPAYRPTLPGFQPYSAPSRLGYGGHS